MADSGLTHGGFYRHFNNKDALVAASVREAFDEIIRLLDERMATVGAAEAVKDYLDYYLSDEHVANPSQGCPIPTLAGEITRGSDSLRSEFGDGVNRALTVLAKGFPDSPSANRTTAMRELAMRVGAILIARASDGQTAKDVLAACRTQPPKTRT